MPFPFVLPTTSNLSFPDYFSSSTHPSLPLAATSSRGALRRTLKAHKRLPTSSQSSNLTTILAALNEYIPYLFALDGGLSGTSIAGEEVDVVLLKELQVEWRAVLSSPSVPGREPSRVRLKSLDSEVFCTLSTLAYAYCLLARAQLHALYFAHTMSTEQRAIAIVTAMKHFLSANSIFTYLVSRCQHNPPPASIPDISQSVLSGLASLTLAEATLITVLKDDPYPAAVNEARSKESKDWMFKNPDIPKVRAHLFARLCLAAGEHANRAQGMMQSSRVDGDLLDYCDDLRRTARAKACRFFGVDAELEGKTGVGIAWLRAAKKELGFAGEGASEAEGKKFGGGLRKLKKEWSEKREDKKIEKGGEWGSDAGKFEEGRVVDMLEKKWVKQNDTVNVQLIPSYEPLLANMPSGREYHTSKPYQVPALDEEVIARMRAPPDPNDLKYQEEDDDSDFGEDRSDPVGAFPVGYCLSVQLLSNMARSIRELGTITFQASISKVVNTRREQD